MGALPKRKVSATRRGKRQAHASLVLPVLVPCPRCQALAKPHQVCPSCGTYAGREVLKVKTTEKK